MQEEEEWREPSVHLAHSDKTDDTLGTFVRAGTFPSLSAVGVSLIRGSRANNLFKWSDV